MALRKGATKPAEAKAAEDKQPVEEQLVKDEDTPPVEDTQSVEDAAKDTGKMILVRNRARFDYVQPSTGIKIYRDSSKPTKVLDDCWVEQFVAAGLLELA